MRCVPASANRLTYRQVMCRSIKTLRAPYVLSVTDEDVQAAALQYVRTISGYRLPSPADKEAFDDAVERIRVITHDLLSHLKAPVAG